MRVSELITNMRRPRVTVMKDLKKLLASSLIFSTLCAGVLGSEPQKDQREPPPKDPKVFDKRDKEPKREEPRREERQRPKENKREKPPG